MTDETVQLETTQPATRVVLGTGVLGDIGQGLADDEVGDGLGRRVEPADIPDLDGDGHGGAGVTLSWGCAQDVRELVERA